MFSRVGQKNEYLENGGGACQYYAAIRGHFGQETLVTVVAML